MFDSIRKAFQAHLLTLDHSPDEEIDEKVDQIDEPNTLLRDIDEPHCVVLAISFRNYDNSYSCSMKTVYLSSTVNSQEATYVTAVHNVNDTKLLEDIYCMYMLDGRHWRCLAKFLGDENSLKWAFQPLRIRYKLRADREPIASAQALELRKNFNISSAIERPKATFTDTMQSNLSYVWAFQENNSVLIVDLRITDTVEVWIS